MLLEVKEVYSGYGDSEILHGVSLDVDEGQFVAVLGPNGAGKTTLLKTIMGVLKPTRGKVLFDKSDITSSSPDKVLRHGIAYVPQGRSIFPWMSVEDNLEMGAYLVRDRQLVTQRVGEVFKLFPRLRERKDSDAGVLSGGERQMLVIGRALMLAPKVIMLDEPSLGLDPKFLELVYQKIVELNKTGITIVLVEQNVKKALQIASFAYVLETGTIMMKGSSSELGTRSDIKDIYLGASARNRN